MSSEIKFSKFSGINNQSPESALTPNEQVSAVNVDVTDAGYFVLRDAFVTLFPDVAVSSLYAHNNLLFYVERSSYSSDDRNNALVSYDPEIGEKLVRDFPLNNEVAYVSVADRLYYSDGLVVRRGNNAGDFGPWGIVPPRSTPVVTPLAAGTDRYLLTATFNRNDGEESGAPTPLAFKSSAGTIMLSNIPVSADSQVVSTSIYLTPPNGEELYRVADLAAGTTDATLIVPLATSGRRLDSLHKTPPPASLVLGAWNGRLLVGASIYLIYSDQFRLEWFDPLHNYIPFPSAPTAVIPISTELLIVGTEDAIYRFDGSDIATARMTKIADYGIYRGAWTFVDGSLMDGGVGRAVMLLSKEGICSITSGGGISNMTRKRYGISKRVVPEYPDNHLTFVAGSALAKQTKGRNQVIFSLHN